VVGWEDNKGGSGGDSGKAEILIWRNNKLFCWPEAAAAGERAGNICIYVTNVHVPRNH
jgi:hypothetical protein